jgi:hypothetical protein
MVFLVNAFASRMACSTLIFLAFKSKVGGQVLSSIVAITFSIS